MPLLTVDELHKSFRRPRGPAVHAVDGVSFELAEGETLGLIGESGSGKSTVARLVLGLTQPDAGRVILDGSTIQDVSRRRLRHLRSQFQMVFQEPLESLNPSMRVGTIVEEPLLLHRRGLTRRERRLRVAEAFDQVGLEQGLLGRLPRELSGGQQQRVGIARAIVLRPKLVVLDEPTASLDLSVRGLILALLQGLRERLRLSYLFISHDIATVGHFCDRTAVMYRGRIVEIGATDALLASPTHPYTQALLAATLSIDPDQPALTVPLKGDIGEETASPGGCVFAGRCPVEIATCSATRPRLLPTGGASAAACIRIGETTPDRPAKRNGATG